MHRMTQLLPLPDHGRLAGIDYGHKRIGIALCDPDQIFASPACNYQRSSITSDERYFQNLAMEEELVGFVVGLPLHLSGAESQKSVEAREFANWLSDRTSLPVTLHDERYTSVQAEAILQSANLTKKKRKNRLDMLAAQLILTSYLESRRDDGLTPPNPLAD